MNDIIKDPTIHEKPPSSWDVDGEPVSVSRIDETTVRYEFAAPYPGFLIYLATGGSYMALYAAKHVLAPLHIRHNSNADIEAKAAGFDDWLSRFRLYWSEWKDELYDTEESLKVSTLDSHALAEIPKNEERRFTANPYYFKLDSSGQQLPYIESRHERFVAKELFILEIVGGRVHQKSQNLATRSPGSSSRRDSIRNRTELTPIPGAHLRRCPDRDKHRAPTWPRYRRPKLVRLAKKLPQNGCAC